MEFWFGVAIFLVLVAWLGYAVWDTIRVYDDIDKWDGL